MATKTAFKPLGNRVVVEPSEGDEQVSAGGIYIPDTAKEKTSRRHHNCCRSRSYDR